MSNLKTRTTALVAALAALAPLGSAATGIAHASGSAKPKLTIKTQNGDFSGTIKARSRHCMNNRQVIVFRQLGSHHNLSVDEEVASDTSSLQNGRGRWDTGNTGLRDGKRYYAYAPAKGGCKRLFSRTVRTVLDNEQ
jgi:hypothetical protein